ncbi:MAG: HisA/HisF-related TIM barrel protein [Gemmatimonadaceae bacterium]|jgi:phosphoribosylformimino-5-aminoimidazole carboxamide ribotide isomerase
MIAIPAVDLRDGACVQLVGGSYAEEIVRLENPPAVARGWAEIGFRKLHVVDLDAATGASSNSSMIETILRDTPMEVQVGGGVRSREEIDRLLGAGASRVVLGTRAVEEPDWLVSVVAAYPGAIMVAADVRGRNVVTRGWARTLPLDIVELATGLNSLRLAGLLVTAVDYEGRMGGTDLALMDDVVAASKFPVTASGGITSLFDLRALECRGVSAAVIGMALYTGAMDPRAVAQEFSE